jgi:hypothetical protein
MSVRLHSIVAKGIEDTIRTMNEEHLEERIVDLVGCIDRMERLKKDLLDNARIRNLIDDDITSDTTTWNKEIAKYFRDSTFMNAPWLFAEVCTLPSQSVERILILSKAYKYRRLHECFALSKYWHDYDVFFRQKCDTFSRSNEAVFELASRFARPFELDKQLDQEKQVEATHLVFRELTQVCLWGK